MDTKGKGPLLLLLASTLVLCQNVASRPTCAPGDKCHLVLQELYQRAKTLSWSVHFYTLDMLLELMDVHSQRPGYFAPAKQRCRMADILTPYWQNKARLMQEKDLVHMAVYLLNSWNDTLPGLALDTHILLKFYHPHSSKDRNITLTYQQLKEVTVQIASQLDIEVPDKVNFALQSYTESLMSSDERTLLFSVYSTLRCFFIDVKKIHFLFSLLKCRADNKVNC